MTDPLSRLRAGLDRDEAIARAAIDDSPHWIATSEGVDQVESDGRYEVVTGYFTQTRRPQANDHIANHDPSRVLRQVAAIRDNVIRPYEQSCAAVDAIASQYRDAATRHTLAALRRENGGDEIEERRAREALLSAEVQRAADVATRDALASVIEALASIYPEDTTETGDIR